MLQLFDFVAVAVFAISGSIVASRLKLDLLAFIFFATFTGLGGGTLRDLVLDVPVLWIHNHIYLIICMVCAVIIWFFAENFESWGHPLRWADAIGISAYTVIGAAKALEVGVAPLAAVLMGVATATFGGVIRDVIARQPSAIIKSEIYLTATFVGAVVFVTLSCLGAPEGVDAFVGGAAAFLLRGGAIRYGWSLPAYKPRGGS